MIRIDLEPLMLQLNDGEDLDTAVALEHIRRAIELPCALPRGTSEKLLAALASEGITLEELHA